jgi:hypothetical protein
MIALLPFYLLIGLLCLIWAQPIIYLAKPEKTINPLLLCLVGMAFLSIISMFLVFGGPIKLYTQVLFWISSSLLFYLNKENILTQIKLIKSIFKAWTPFQSVSFLLVSIAILYQSAQASKIHDNGAYYQQTIQWMEQYGLVKGLANLYPALGLYSNWHALTALLDLNQIGLGSTHQINGFLMLLFFAWALIEFYVSNKWTLYLWVSIQVVLGFFYLTAPSADLPVMLFSGILVYYFVKGISQNESLLFGLIALAVFVIKPPALLGLLFFCYLLYFNKNVFKNFLLLCIFGLLMAGSFVYKNTILSGYAMYPNAKPNVFDLEWKVPENWNKVYRQGVISWGISDSQKIKNWDSNSQQIKSSRFETWLSRPGYKGLMNKLLFINWLIALTCLVLFWKKLWQKHQLVFIFITALLFAQYWEWLSLSQYRLLLPSGLSLFYLWLFLFMQASKHDDSQLNFQKIGLIGLVLIMWIFSFFPFHLFNKTSRNQDITQSSGFNTQYLIEPFHQFEYGPMSFFRSKKGVFYYYRDTKLSWNCALPCVSKSHHDFLYENLGYEVQMLGDSPKDGFKMVKNSN